jgi:hypothetical protein
MPFDAFISYSHKDKLIADSACGVVEASGIRCWIAPRDIRPGAEWGEAISEGIDHCRVMILIFSANSNESRQVRREVARGFNQGLTIVPVRVEMVEPNRALAFQIETFHWLDALNEPRERYFRELARHLKAILETPPEPFRAGDEEPHRAADPRQQDEKYQQGNDQGLKREKAERQASDPARRQAVLPVMEPEQGTLSAVGGMPRPGWAEWAARLGSGLIAGFVLLTLIVALLYALMGEDTSNHFIYLWGGYVGGFSEYTVWFLLKWGRFWGLCFAMLEKYLALRRTGYWWYVALCGVAVGAVTFVWDVFAFSSAFTGVYFADPANALTLPTFLWTALALLLWIFGLAAFLRWWIPWLGKRLV